MKDHEPKTAREILLNKLDGFVANKFKEGVATNIIKDRQFLQAVIDEYAEIEQEQHQNGMTEIKIKVKE